MTKSRGLGKPRYGNKYNNKLKKMKDLGILGEAYKSYCDHQAEGWMRETWCFEKGDFVITWETMEKHIQENPSDFPPDLRNTAFAKGYKHWEGVVKDSASGKNKDANNASLAMLMRNKYKWDRQEKQSEALDVNKLLELAKFFSSIPSS